MTAKTHNEATKIETMTIRAAATLAVLSAMTLAATAPAQEIKFAKHEAPMARVVREEKIRERLTRQDDRVEVLVNLAQSDANQAVPNLDRVDHKAARKQLVKAKAERVLSRMAEDRVRVKRTLEMQATIWADVTAEGLEALRADPDVESIEPVEQMEFHDVQGSTLMNALGTRPQFGGAGVAIAIVDSGVDYSHPLLGGGGFPNEKVIGGFDIGDNDADPFPIGEAHGTACAGIAAGNIAAAGDYNGGIAPDAKIYAVKVDTRGQQGVSNAAQLAAWD